MRVLPALLLLVLLQCASASFVLGHLDTDLPSRVVRMQPFGPGVAPPSPQPPVAIECNPTCVITALWVDRDSQTLFSATRSPLGTSGALSRGSRFLWVFGDLVQGDVVGLTGSHAVRSPSLYWVWRPTAPTSPPFNNRPALYRVPLLGGIPEVVTLNAQPCLQMTSVGDTLFCLGLDGHFYSYALTLPNGPFVELSVPGLPVNETLVGFVAARGSVLLVATASRLVYRSDRPASQVPRVLPANMTSPWSPTLYDEATDRLTVSLGGQVVQYVGVDAFWANNGTVWGPTSLRVVAFSVASLPGVVAVSILLMAMMLL